MLWIKKNSFPTHEYETALSAVLEMKKHEIIPASNHTELYP